MKNQKVLLIVMLGVLAAMANPRPAQANERSDRVGATTGIRFTVDRDKAVNAYANGAGQIHVFQGLLDRIEQSGLTEKQKDAALAGVLGHEFTHVAEHHIARQNANMSEKELYAGIFDRAVPGHSVLKGLAEVTFLLSGYQKGSLDSENAADVGSIALMVANGYPANAINLAFAVIQGTKIDLGTIPQGLCMGIFGIKDHPSFASRTDNINKTIAKRYPNGVPAPDQVTPDRPLAGVTIFVEQARLSDEERDLVIVGLKKVGARVFEKPETARYRLQLNLSVVDGNKYSSQGVGTQDFDIEVSSGSYRFRGRFVGKLVEQSTGEVIEASSKPAQISHKTQSGLYVRAGRWAPIRVERHSYGDDRQIGLQTLVEAGVEAWSIDIMGKVSATRAQEAQALAAEKPDFWWTPQERLGSPGEIWRIFPSKTSLQELGKFQVLRVRKDGVCACKRISGEVFGDANRDYRLAKGG